MVDSVLILNCCSGEGSLDVAILRLTVILSGSRRKRLVTDEGRTGADQFIIIIIIIIITIND